MANDSQNNIIKQKFPENKLFLILLNNNNNYIKHVNYLYSF